MAGDKPWYLWPLMPASDGKESLGSMSLRPTGAALWEKSLFRPQYSGLQFKGTLSKVNFTLGMECWRRNRNHIYLAWEGTVHNIFTRSCNRLAESLG